MGSEQIPKIRWKDSNAYIRGLFSTAFMEGPSLCTSGGHNDEEIEDFYARLRETIRTVKQHDMSLLMGDFNAKVGQEDGIWRDVTRYFGIDLRKKN